MAVNKIPPTTKKGRELCRAAQQWLAVLGVMVWALGFADVCKAQTRTIPESIIMTNTQLFGTATIGAGNSTSNNFTAVGMTVHYISYSCTNTVVKVTAYIETSPTGGVGTYQRVSPISYNTIGGGVIAYSNKAFNRVQFSIQTAAGTCTVSYTGTSVTAAQLNGIYGTTGAVLIAWHNSTAAASYSFTFQPNTGRSGGTLWFQYVQPLGQCTNLTVALDAYPDGISTTPGQIRMLPANFTGSGGGFGSPTGSTVMAQVDSAQPFTIPDMQATDMDITVTTNASCGGGVPMFNIWFAPDAYANGIPVAPSPPAGPVSAVTLVNSTAYEASHVGKASSGNLYGFCVYNSAGSTQYYMAFNAAALPANGTAPSIAPLAVASATTMCFTTGEYPVNFSTGIVVGNSTTAPTLTTGAADSWFSIFLK